MKIDLTSGKKCKEVKSVKRKIPQVREPKKKAVKQPKYRKKAAEIDLDAIEKKHNIKILRVDKHTRNHSIYRIMADEIKKRIPSTVVGIYELGKENNIKKTVGEPLPSIAAERYFSLCEPTVFVNPCGISDAPRFRNRLVMRFRYWKTEYLLIVSSYAFEILMKDTVRGRINKIIKTFGGRII